MRIGHARCVGAHASHAVEYAVVRLSGGRIGTAKYSDFGEAIRAARAAGRGTAVAPLDSSGRLFPAWCSDYDVHATGPKPCDCGDCGECMRRGVAAHAAGAEPEHAHCLHLFDEDVDVCCGCGEEVEAKPEEEDAHGPYLPERGEWDPKSLRTRLQYVVRCSGGIEVIARRIGRRPGLVEAWLRGQRNPSSADLGRLSLVTATSLGWLISGDSDNVDVPLARMPAPAHSWLLGIRRGDELKLDTRDLGVVVSVGGVYVVPRLPRRRFIAGRLGDDQAAAYVELEPGARVGFTWGRVVEANGRRL